MEHKEYIRYIEGSANAVLLIHGIAGTPAHFRDLLPEIPLEYSIYNILLAGHGKDVGALSAASMKQWKQQVQDMLALLFSRHRRVFIAAHSMGTLFAIQAAIDFPEKIPGLFLLAVPVRPWLPVSTMLTSLRVAWGNIRPNDTKAIAMQNASSVRMTRKLWKYLGWIPRFLELLAECRRVRQLLPQLQTPTLAFQSRVDELVSVRSAKDLTAISSIECTVLKESGHFAYSREDTQLLQRQFQKFLTG